MIRIRHVVTGITLMLALAACRGPEAEQARQDAAAAADHAAAATDQIATTATPVAPHASPPSPVRAACVSQ